MQKLLTGLVDACLLSSCSAVDFGEDSRNAKLKFLAVRINILALNGHGTLLLQFSISIRQEAESLLNIY